MARQDSYARWLAAEVPSPPASILDLGCGNGSLLLALRQLWPHVVLRGIDPSPESSERARVAGIDVLCGHAGTTCAEASDLVISVNVIEHVESPVDFLRSIGTFASPIASMILVCPDGERAWLELLFADHLWSFAATHIARLALAAGLGVAGSTTAPPDLGPIRLFRLTRHHRADVPPCAPDDLVGNKRRYLQAWSLLEQDLLARTAAAPSLACFGMGETAALLRTYAPEVWSRVKMCLADGPEQPTFGDVPVIDYAGDAVEWPVLLGVRPAAQPALARRLVDSGCSVVRWDDLIAV